MATILVIKVKSIEIIYHLFLINEYEYDKKRKLYIINFFCRILM
jgi:hypothetical protein